MKLFSLGIFLMGLLMFGKEAQEFGVVLLVFSIALYIIAKIGAWWTNA